MQMVGWGGKKVRNPSDSRKGATLLVHSMADWRFPLSTIHMAVETSRFLGLLFCFPSSHCISEGGKFQTEGMRETEDCTFAASQAMVKGVQRDAFGGLSFIER